ncbi:MAG: hypothetical protein NXH75_04385 [Halobacteriovoraceae bacterium]|nr:hypothetical protein [Halobacteriovoraceae bacterium]
MISYANKADYLARKPSAKPLAQMDLGTAAGKSKEGIKEGAKEAIKTPTEKVDIKEQVKEIPKKIKDKVLEGKDAGDHLLTQAGSALIRGVSSMGIPGISIPDVAVKTEASKATNKTIADQPRVINKPGIFFIKGFSLNPFSSDDEGLAAMSKNIPTAKVFGWSDEDSIIEEIQTRPHNQPIILVGHGMGGDTAVSIANKLNGIDHAFRKVELLVTMDSIGTDNDIIPQNVKENYNLISDEDFLFNDGPNIARKKEKTKVDNLLLEEGHNNMDTNPEIQFLVYEKINNALMDAIAARDTKKKLSANIIGMHRFPSPAASLSLLGQS